MSRASRRLAGVLLGAFPTVILGGVSLLRLLVDDPAYRDNPLRQDLWQVGHARRCPAGADSGGAALRRRGHPGARAKWFARHSIPVAAILLPAAFFLSVTDAGATEPNALISLAYIGPPLLAAGLLTLGIGLVRAGAQ